MFFGYKDEDLWVKKYNDECYKNFNDIVFRIEDRCVEWIFVVEFIVFCLMVLVEFGIVFVKWIVYVIGLYCFERVL